jgi:hypothetical protein
MTAVAGADPAGGYLQPELRYQRSPGVRAGALREEAVPLVRTDIDPGVGVCRTGDQRQLAAVEAVEPGADRVDLADDLRQVERRDPAGRRYGEAGRCAFNLAVAAQRYVELATVPFAGAAPARRSRPAARIDCGANV